MRRSNLLHVKTVRRSGRAYEYFNTGQNENGRPVYIRLPDKRDPNFGTAYATAMANRSRRQNIRTLMTVRECADRYMADRKFTARSESTQKTYLIYIRKIVEGMGAAPLIGVERRDVRAMLLPYESTPVAAQMLLNVFRQLVRFARARDWLTEDVSAGIEIEHQAVPYEPWPEAMIEAGLKDPAVRLPIALLYFTAQRISDVCKMRWAHIEDGEIHLQQQKTGKPVVVPIHSRLQAILDMQARGLTTIIADARGVQRSPAAVRHAIKSWLMLHQQHHLNVHGLRKNGVNALLEAGCTVAETAAISGQSLAMVEHYAKGRDTRKLGRRAMQKWDWNK
jgi:integrase